MCQQNLFKVRQYLLESDSAGRMKNSTGIRIFTVKYGVVYFSDDKSISSMSVSKAGAGALAKDRT